MMRHFQENSGQISQILSAGSDSRGFVLQGFRAGTRKSGKWETLHEY